MKLEQIIAQLASSKDEEEEIKTTAARFLYGKNPTTKRITKAAATLLASPPFDSDDYALVRHCGANAIVMMNDKGVFKLDTEKFGFREDSLTLPLNAIPSHLCAAIFKHGKCNNIGYAYCERLNTERLPAFEEIIPFLFKARDAGVVFIDPQPANLAMMLTKI